MTFDKDPKTVQWGKDSGQPMMLEKLDFHMQRMKLNPILHLQKTRNAKNLNVRAKTTKTLSFLEENIDGKIYDMDMTPNAQTIIGKEYRYIGLH